MIDMLRTMRACSMRHGEIGKQCFVWAYLNVFIQSYRHAITSPSLIWNEKNKNKKEKILYLHKLALHEPCSTFNCAIKCERETNSIQLNSIRTTNVANECFSVYFVALSFPIRHCISCTKDVTAKATHGSVIYAVNNATMCTNSIHICWAKVINEIKFNDEHGAVSAIELDLRFARQRIAAGAQWYVDQDEVNGFAMGCLLTDVWKTDPDRPNDQSTDATRRTLISMETSHMTVVPAAYCVDDFAIFQQCKSYKTADKTKSTEFLFKTKTMNVYYVQ